MKHTVCNLCSKEQINGCVDGEIDIQYLDLYSLFDFIPVQICPNYEEYEYEFIPEDQE